VTKKEVSKDLSSPQDPKDRLPHAYIDFNHDKIIKTKMIKTIDIKRYLITFDFFVLDFNKLINVILFGSL
jgi:hypothetical protein